MKVRPLNDRVLVLRLPQPDVVGKTGVLFRPEVSKTAPQEGLVLAVGEGRSYDGPGEVVVHEGRPGDDEPGYIVEICRQHPRLAEGDLVIFGKFSGSEVELASLSGEPLFLLREDEVIGVIEEPDEELQQRSKLALEEYRSRQEPVTH